MRHMWVNSLIELYDLKISRNSRKIFQNKIIALLKFVWLDAPFKVFKNEDDVDYYSFNTFSNVMNNLKCNLRDPPAKTKFVGGRMVIPFWHLRCMGDLFGPKWTPRALDPTFWTFRGLRKKFDFWDGWFGVKNGQKLKFEYGSLDHKI